MQRIAAPGQSIAPVPTCHDLRMTAGLTPTTTRNDQYERDLQDLFMSWNVAPPARAWIAGCPRSLAFAGDLQREYTHRAWGCHSRADIVGDTADGRRLVIELKLGAKYEPIGLPEVLFHAERLARTGGQVHPVLVTQYNLWNRVVIDSLYRRTLGDRFMEYYEFVVVDVDGAPCFWFDAPLEPWHPIDSPADMIASFARGIGDAAPDAAWLRGALHWYEISATRTYVATSDRYDQRPAVIGVPYLMLAPIEDGNSRWIAWAGVPPAEDAVSSVWSMDRYWICQP